MSSFNSIAQNSPSTRVTSQQDFVPLREAEQARNHAGGVSFKVTPWDRLDRFLILGTEGATYYASERAMVKENATSILALIKQDGIRVVNRVVEISDAGRASKNDPALFVLAMASAAENLETRKAAFSALPKVARIGTHLFHYAAFVEGFRGWGRALCNAVANWYTEMPVDRLANQVIKYQQRDGWSHRDLLRLSHPKTADAGRDAIFNWVVGGVEKTNAAGKLSNLHPQILAFEAAKTAGVDEILSLIRDHDLPREAIPTEHLTDARVWEALLENMPMTAMIRNLATMTRVGLLTPRSAAEQKIKDALGNADVLRRARIHPLQVLAAHMTYKAGHGNRSQHTWLAVPGVVDALDAAFYTSFQNVEPTNKKTMLALDVSGSMTGGEIGGIPGLNPRVASAALALVTANVESNFEIYGFTAGGTSSYSGRPRTYGRNSGISKLAILPGHRLDQVVSYINGLGFSGTDCALPITHAGQAGLDVESFAVYTDNETWAGSIQPHQALVNYRQATGLRAKLAVVGMTATNFTIADPTDAGMMDFVGFDMAAPAIMADFFRN